ncbi:hypothetical protein [Microbulbifer sp. THAF38]|uniref:hypothetical protein n=1 Tax=Microbulbifer sp. THAF38 TaxID=2587856 RepID=UPI001268E2B8|nr:hypothetical protein [Microbulbifer sp. THAF38]QFT53282.1 hypothetical protein FIU95_01635 [Microbulbifer sp. THAF38]
MEEVVGGIIRFAFHFLFDVVARLIFEIFFYFPGYYISKLLPLKKEEPSFGQIFFSSVFFWFVVGLFSYVVYSNFADSATS